MNVANQPRSLTSGEPAHLALRLGKAREEATLSGAGQAADVRLLDRFDAFDRAFSIALDGRRVGDADVWPDDEMVYVDWNERAF